MGNGCRHIPLLGKHQLFPSVLSVVTLGRIMGNQIENENGNE